MKFDVNSENFECNQINQAAIGYLECTFAMFSSTVKPHMLYEMEHDTSMITMKHFLMKLVLITCSATRWRFRYDVISRKLKYLNIDKNGAC